MIRHPVPTSARRRKRANSSFHEVLVNSAFWHRKRVLVTGGCGFVGRWVCRALRPAEVDLHILDLAPSAHLEEKHTFHRTDMRNLAATSELIGSVKPAADHSPGRAAGRRLVARQSRGRL